jgi:hypothetical protein
MLPSSPYDPRATPSFRHSPPRLPSDQPWRFPSPSHPLHSKADISLGQVAINSSSPSAVSAPHIDVSPVYIAPRSGRSSVFHTPSGLNQGHGINLSASKPTPRRLFMSGGVPASLTERLRKAYRPAEESPLRHSNFTPRFSKILDSLDSGIVDPFSFEGAIRGTPAAGSDSPPTTSPESDSPIMRTTKLSDSVMGSGGARRTGLGLLEAFSLKRGYHDDDEVDEDDDEDDGEDDYRFSGRLHLASPVSRCRLTQSKSYSDLALKNSPTTSRSGSSSSESRKPMRKRRRTLVD